MTAPRAGAGARRRHVLRLVLPVLLAACSPGGSPDGGAAAGTVPGEVSAGTAEEWFAARARCIEEAGWQVDHEPGSTALEVREVRPDQREAFQRVLDGCDERLGPPPTPGPPGEEETARFYEALLETRECLAGEGYTIGEPPTLERFRRGWEAGIWHPYEDLPETTPQEWERLNEVCPQPGR